MTNSLPGAAGTLLGRFIQILHLVGVELEKVGDEGHQLSFIPKDDGLYATSGLMIIVR